jgi:hypothetical protein
MRVKVALIASFIALGALGALTASLVATGAPLTAGDVTTANEPSTSAHLAGSRGTEAAPKRRFRSQLHVTWQTFKTSTAS